ncbi:PIN domain-containing protein [candidate division KSB1 bacterium]|nr:PIN domain-containing protein [candidate division KSB1 bacterium]
MKLAYIDSCVWIARVEGLPEYQKVIDANLQTLAEEGWTFCTSDVVVLEVLAKPLRENQDHLVQIYRNIIQKLKTLKNYSGVFKNALSLTKSENLKGMDAIHVAIAEHHNCQLFVTSDPHFRNLKIVPPQLINLSKSVAR